MEIVFFSSRVCYYDFNFLYTFILLLEVFIMNLIFDLFRGFYYGKLVWIICVFVKIF